MEYEADQLVQKTGNVCHVPWFKRMLINCKSWYLLWSFQVTSTVPLDEHTTLVTELHEDDGEGHVQTTSSLPVTIAASTTMNAGENTQGVHSAISTMSTPRISLVTTKLQQTGKNKHMTLHASAEPIKYLGFYLD